MTSMAGPELGQVITPGTAVATDKQLNSEASILRARETFTSEPTKSNEEAVDEEHGAIQMAALPLDRDAEHVNTIGGGTIKTLRQERIASVSLWWCLFLAGWNDASTGPLLPRIQLNYNVNFTIVSLVFIANFIGFMSAAILNVKLTDRYGFGVVISLGAAFQVVAYAIDAPAPPFPLFVIAFAVNGFGVALQDAQSNVFTACLPNPDSKMGLLHAAYGLGALIAPLAATQFAQIQHWSFHYLVSLGIAISNFIVLAIVFRFRTQEELLGVSEHHTDAIVDDRSKYRRMFSLKTLHLLAFFALVYVGIEVTIGGWIVTYIIDVRGGGPSAGYVSAGFFGGLTLGRVALLWINKKIGARYVVMMYCLLSIALEVVVWQVKHIIGDAVAVSLVGMLLGPIYPIMMNVSSRILPRSLLAGSIGWIASFGQAGSAVFPFLTGALAQKEGVQVLEPLLVAMLGLLIGLWAVIPTRPPQVE